MHVLRKWDIAILLSMGIGLSCWFWRFQAMPAPDFSTFLDVGRSLWHLRLPENMQRAPFYGLIIYPLSFLMPGPHAAWTAAMVLNAVLFPITLVLIYLVVRQYHERAAMWVACLAAINPFTLELMTRPLCETLLVFLVTLTLWLWRKHPGWAYLAACLATLVRPDVGGLILTVAVVDKSKWMVRMSHVILAAVPMVTWVLLARYTATDKGLVYYTQLLDPARWFEVQGWHSLAQTVVWPLPATVPVMVGLGLAICLSAWRAWPVMLFVVPYVLIHIGYAYREPRMWVPILWPCMLMVVCGWIRVYRRWPRLAVWGLMAVVVAYILSLSPTVMGNGDRDAEFVGLLDWYKAHAMPGEKMACTLAAVMVVMDPTLDGLLVPMSELVESTPEAFVVRCRKDGIRWVAWDSREGFAVDRSVWYDRNKLSNIAALAQAKSQGDYMFVTQIRHPRDPRKAVNVFKVKPRR